MPERIQSFKAVCRGGLQSSENHLDLSEGFPGSAVRLVNYEVSLFGGYRRVNGYQLFDDQNPEIDPDNCEGPVLGIAIFDDPETLTTKFIAARKEDDANVYHFYEYVPLSGWARMTLPSGVSRVFNDSVNNRTVSKIRHETFNFGDGNKIIFVDGVNPAIVWDGAEWHVLTSAGGTAHGHSHGEPHGGNQIVDAPAVVEIFENHVFLGGDTLNPAVICHSAPNSGFDFTAASGAGQLIIGFDLVQFKPFRENFFVFGKNSIKRVLADPTAGFIIQPVTANIGCIARDSVVELGGDLVFLAPDGLRPVAGTSRIGDVELETISRPIQSIVQFLGKDYDLDTLNAVVVRTKSQLRYFIGSDSIPVEDAYGIVGGLRAVESNVQWEFGELQGIRASVCTSGFVGREEYVLHGDYDGKVYRQEQGNSFDGRDILAIYQTPYLDFGDTEVRKTMRRVNTFIRAEGPLTMNLSITYNWDDPEIKIPNAYSSTSAGSPTKYKGAGVNYAAPSAVYGGVEKPVIQTAVQGSGFSAQVTYVSLGQDAPHSIQGIVFEFSIAGRN
jgi:hypothetical protein